MDIFNKLFIKREYKLAYELLFVSYIYLYKGK